MLVWGWLLYSVLRVIPARENYFSPFSAESQESRECPFLLLGFWVRGPLVGVFSLKFSLSKNKTTAPEQAEAGGARGTMRTARMTLPSTFPRTENFSYKQAAAYAMAYATAHVEISPLPSSTLRITTRTFGNPRRVRSCRSGDKRTCRCRARRDQESQSSRHGRLCLFQTMELIAPDMGSPSRIRARDRK